VTDKQAANPDAPAARVVIFEDRTGLLEGLEAYLARWTDFEVVATATTPNGAAEIVKDVDNIDFDAAIVDLELVQGTSVPHGFDIANQIRELRPSALVYIWSLYTTEGDLIRRASRVIRGRLLVDGVVSKHSSNANLVKAITTKLQVPEVGLWLDTDLQPPTDCYSAIDHLKPAEERNLRVLAQRPGATREQLITELHIAEGTWSKQLGPIKEKVAIEVAERMQRGVPTDIEVSCAEEITTELLTRWARARNLHWPVLDFESNDAP
jgi:DNA-binding NarL/FixJ family response regulator